MNTIATHSNLVFRERKTIDIIDKPCGFLTSNYKQIAADNYANPNPESLYVKRHIVKSRLLNNPTTIATILKLSLFLGLLSFIL